MQNSCRHVVFFPTGLTEAEGFEPSLPFRADRFSKPAHSTTLPRLHGPDGRARPVKGVGSYRCRGKSSNRDELRKFHKPDTLSGVWLDDWTIRSAPTGALHPNRERYYTTPARKT